MAEYLSPGVYVEEVATGPRPIEGVSTSTAGFAGVAERGPTHPRLVTSWPDYQRWFGGYLDPGTSYLPASIQGFFENGGQRAFIARVVAGTAAAATLDLNPAPGAAGDAANTRLRVWAIGKGAWGNGLLIRVKAASLTDPGSAATRDLFRMQILYYAKVPAPFVDPFNPANLANPYYVAPDSSEDYDNLSPDPSSPDYAITTLNGRSRLVTAGYISTVANGTPAPVRPADRDFGTAASHPFATATANLKLVLTAGGPGAWGNQVAVTIQAGTQANTSAVTIAGFGRTETLDNLTAATILPRINGSSKLKLVTASWDNPNVAPALPNNGASNLGGGLDAHPIDGADNNPTAQDYIGDSSVRIDQRTGLAGLEAIEEISLLCVPDEVRNTFAGQITNAMVDQCERLRYRFAILSTEEDQEDSGDVSQVNPPRDSSYAAVYYPWVRVIDPRTQRDYTVPAAGHVAGIYARVDVERGVHKAPANEVVQAIVTRDLGPNRKPLDYIINKQEHDILNPKGVDVIRDFRNQGRGIRVWGARTMSTDTQWKYVNVRRLFIFVEASIDRGTQWVVFEPNDETTWSAVRRSLTGFLTSVWRSGALMGTTADEAFFVKCDLTTMTQDDLDNGRLICLVGIAPVKPAEFVIFRISQLTADASS